MVTACSFFETDEALASAVAVLSGLGTSARKLLEECVCTQGLARKSMSKAARDLENAGFVFVRDHSDIFASEFELSPTLAGEEALEALENKETSATEIEQEKS